MILSCRIVFLSGGNNLKNKTKLRYQILILLCSILYLALLIKIIILKNGTIYQNNFNLQLFSFLREYQYLGLTFNLIANVLGNIALFVPLSIILKYYFIFLSNGQIIFIGTCTSLSFELIQLATRWGIFDINDIILNTIGCIIGILLYLIIQKLKNSNLVTIIFLSSFTTLYILSAYAYYPRFIMI